LIPDRILDCRGGHTQDWARLRLLDQAVELVEVLDWCQIRMHLSSV
jgi:hypothetical protein